MPIIAKIKLWLSKFLGTKYAAVISTADRAATAFGLVFATKLIGGSGFSIAALAHWSYWQTAAVAGLLAAVSVLKSAIMTAVTGVPALLSLISSTLRAQRGITRKPQHSIPLRPTPPAPAKHAPPHATVAK
jgi:hypothetical protein